MRVVVVGGGRIGLPISRASKGAGHEVGLVVRQGAPIALAGIQTIPAAAVGPWADLVILAVGPGEERKLGSQHVADLSLHWLADLPAGTPIASVVANTNRDTLQKICGPRPLARFLCTPAVEVPESVRFVDDESDFSALAALKNALPSQVWFSVPPQTFDHYGWMLVASAVFCAAFARCEEILLREGVPPDRGFLLSMLQEAERMISEAGGDAERAVESAATPGGLTRRLVEEIFGRDLLMLRSDCPDSGEAR